MLWEVIKTSFDF